MVSRREVFWAPKIASEAISQHQIQKKFSGGACPPDPPSFCVHTNVATQVFVPIRRTNAILLRAGPVLVL